jgi:hypothetical protein
VQRAIGTPRGQRPGGPAIALVRLVARLSRREIESHDVPRVPGEERSLFRWRDDVVGRAQDQRQIADRLGAIAERTERTDVGHGLLDGSSVGAAEDGLGTLGIVR